jgi:hypothetical protein
MIGPDATAVAPGQLADGGQVIEPPSKAFSPVGADEEDMGLHLRHPLQKAVGPSPEPAGIVDRHQQHIPVTLLGHVACPAQEGIAHQASLHLLGP